MAAKEFDVKLVIRRLEGWTSGDGEGSGVDGDVEGFSVEFRWGDEEESGGKKKGAKLRCTEKVGMDKEGKAFWEDEFRSECWLADWGCGTADELGEIKFKVLANRRKRTSKRSVTLGTASIQLSQWISLEEGKEQELILPVLQSRNGSGENLVLIITLSFSNTGSCQLSSVSSQKPNVPASLSPQLKETVSASNGTSKTKIDIVYERRRWKARGLQKEGAAGSVVDKDKKASGYPEYEYSLLQILREVTLPVKKRKRGVRVAKSKNKVIDLEDSEADCQILDTYVPAQPTMTVVLKGYTSPSLTEATQDGKWGQLDALSRDALILLQTQVFYASIDQRSEEAGGSSACSVLSIVIAYWLHQNKGSLPDQEQFDSLIKEGSMEWRRLQKNTALKESFSNGHFDLKTVLPIRPLSVDDTKSTIAFFRPEGLPEEVLNFLSGTTSFDNLWQEVSEARSGLSGSDSLIYIVGWNDHFLLLKVDSEAYYVIDTLGERLLEDCNKGYILKFDNSTRICKKDSPDEATSTEAIGTDIAFEGHDCCRHYFESFLAAFPLKEAIKDELEFDRLFGKLQIEFSFTKPATG